MIKFKIFNKKAGMSGPFNLFDIDGDSTGEAYYNNKNGFAFHYADNIELLFTGLQDKNGVDIYEGDIDSELKVFTYDVGMGGWYLMRNGEGVQWHCHALTHGGTRLPYEVIGNIHENGDLLSD